MAEIWRMNEERAREYKEWFDARPPAIQELIKRFPPNKLYRLTATGHRVAIIAYSEGETLRVSVLHQFNPEGLAFEREVFGIKPEDMVECDLPPGVEVLD
jgi:hypothetical protein